MFKQESPIGHDKSSELFLFNQENEPLFRSLANIEAVKVELKNELNVINKIILNAMKEVNSTMEEDPYLFMESRFYSQILNAKIKGKLREYVLLNPEFGSKVKIRSRYGASYFIVNDKYLVYIKKLNGNGKPNYVSTPRSENLMNQLPFDGGLESIPILFVGPQFRGLIFEGTSVTSLISKKEVNWNMSYDDLFGSINYETEKSEEVTNLDNLRLKSSKISKNKSS
tara:strand:- start:54979 stop:55656 length:678 start_codon:yes stop_codon:yes gene_type:complete